MAMDDLSDDGVSPPEWQSGSEREPEDDKEIEGNEPDEIPPSDPDSYVGLKEAENNGQWLQCIGKSVEKLPSYDGFLETQLSGMRVPFHVIRSDSTPWDAKQAYSLALLGGAHVVRCHRHLPWSAKAGACRAYSNGGLYA